MAKIHRLDAAHSYATRTLINCYLADRRLKRPVEVLTSQLPDRAGVAPDLGTRVVLLAALAELPPKFRAVVVLRYWTDMSVDEVAAVLGCSPGNVRSPSARAMAKLGSALGDATDPTSAGRPLAGKIRATTQFDGDARLWNLSHT